jgi:LDH2 family malate/lactate/ureidoglycolate dehydrogenase
MRGVSFQGLDHMHTLLSGIRNGHIDPTGQPRIAKESDAFALIDGRRGLGQQAAQLATDVAISKARKSGISCVGITNSSDIFMVGFYAERIARTGLVGFVFTGAPPSVHPYGGRERILGTNPFAIAFPTDEENPVLIDMATSAVSNSFVRQANYYGEELPDNVAVDADGKPTRSAKAVRRAAQSARSQITRDLLLRSQSASWQGHWLAHRSERPSTVGEATTKVRKEFMATS